MTREFGHKSNCRGSTIAWLLIWLVAMTSGTPPTYAETIRGQILSIDQRLNLIWVRGEYCGSRSMCEGAIYGGVRVEVRKDHVVYLERLVLLHPETTNCRTGDGYWALSAVDEAFSPLQKGAIAAHPYSRIVINLLEATPIDLSQATDKSMGFAADGGAYIGALEITFLFDTPFPEDLHAQSFCKEGAAGILPIWTKTLLFGPLPPRSIGTRQDVARRPHD